MSINHVHLKKVVAEMEQGVAATTRYSWLDLAKEILRLRRYIPDDSTPNFDHPEEKEWDISTDGYVNLEVKDGLITVFYDERVDPEEPSKEPADYNQILFWDIDKAEATAHRILAAVATYRSEK